MLRTIRMRAQQQHVAQAKTRCFLRIMHRLKHAFSMSPAGGLQTHGSPSCSRSAGAIASTPIALTAAARTEGAASVAGVQQPRKQSQMALRCCCCMRTNTAACSKLRELHAAARSMAEACRQACSAASCHPCAPTMMHQQRSIRVSMSISM